MAIKFNRSQTFATNGTVTAAALHNLIDGTDIYQALITDQTAMTSVGSLDKLLIADSDLTAADAPRSVTVNELFEDALTLSTYTNVKATNALYTNATGNFTFSTGATITTGTIPNGTFGTTTSTAATITTGTIPTLTSGTTTSTSANITTGTLTNLIATTSTFNGAITGSTNVVNIGSGQIYKAADGDVYFGATSKPVSSINSKVQVVGQGLALASNTNFTPQIGLYGAHSSSSPYILFQRAKTSYSSPTTVSSGDGLGQLYYGGHDGTNYVNGGGLQAIVDGAVSTGTVPVALQFLTGNGFNLERMRIDSSGNVGIGTTSPAYQLNVQSTGAAATVNRGIVLRTGDQTNFFRLSSVYNTTTTSGAFPIQSGGLYWEQGGGYGASGGLVIATNNANAGPVILATSDTERMRIDSSGNVGVGATAPVNKLEVVGSFGRGAPVTKTADFTLADTENWIIVNKAASTCTVTLPAASSWTGREFTIKTLQAFTVVSASSNVVPRNSATPGTAILAAAAGNWATLVSNGTSWVIMCGS